MNRRRWCRLFHIIIALCASLTNAATESGLSSTVTVTPADEGPFSSATPAPGGTETVDPTSTAASDTTQVSEAATVITESGTVITETTTEITETTTEVTETTTEVTETTTVITESPSVPPFQPVMSPQGCVCNLTPDFCDIGCCCDTVDCGVSNLSTVFTGCKQPEATLGVCVEKWLMFRANVESSLVTVTDSLFCVRPKEPAQQSLQAPPQYPSLGDSYHFSPPAPTSSSYSRAFYRVDDVIQTFFSSSSVQSFLRQPSPGPATSLCVNRNPARFLRSVSLSCARMLTPQSCTTDPNLNALSYFSDLNLIKSPINETSPVANFLIPVAPQSDWPAPRKQNNLCVNVVKKVEFIIGYTSRGELTYAAVNMELTDVDPNQLLLQTHSVQFQLSTPGPTPGKPIPAVGLRVGSPVVGPFNGEVTTLTTMGVSQSGECSSDPSRRAPILFTHNTITGCTFSSSSNDCSELRSQIYGILRGLAAPDEMAMNSGSQLSWTRVITQECPVGLRETCDSGCLLPNSLSIQVLWARQGPVDLPQSYILGAKYLFKCKKFKCPLSSPLVLTTEVKFADATVYPTTPRGSPEPDWKFPFGFFTRSAAELDGHIIINGSDTEQVTWSLMLFTVVLLTGLEFFSR